MSLTATISSITRSGGQVSITVTYSDTTTKSYTWDLPLDVTKAGTVIKSDLDILNRIQDQVDTLQQFIGTVIA